MRKRGWPSQHWCLREQGGEDRGRRPGRRVSISSATSALRAVCWGWWLAGRPGVEPAVVPCESRGRWSKRQIWRLAVQVVPAWGSAACSVLIAVPARRLEDVRGLVSGERAGGQASAISLRKQGGGAGVSILSTSLVCSASASCHRPAAGDHAPCSAGDFEKSCGRRVCRRR